MSYMSESIRMIYFHGSHETLNTLNKLFYVNLSRRFGRFSINEIILVFLMVTFKLVSSNVILGELNY